MLFTKIKIIQIMLLLYFMILGLFACDNSSYGAAILDRAPLRAGGGFGFSGGSYQETFMGTTAKVDLPASLGLHGFLGFNWNSLFLAYAPSAISKISSGSNDAGAFTYTAPFALEGGWSNLGHSSIPIELFMGAEHGNFNFVNGTKTSLSGYAGKVGAAIYPFKLSDESFLGFRFEVKRYAMEIDNHGSLDIDTKMTTYFVGLVFAFQQSRSPASAEVVHPTSTPQAAEPELEIPAASETL